MIICRFAMKVVVGILPVDKRAVVKLLPVDLKRCDHCWILEGDESREFT